MANDPAVQTAAARQHDYRPHIDGLRAVAILSVVVFHAAPSLLPGGFVGVDIFFVISGYLISGIIVRQLDQGRFSFADFYSRRIRRIFPALVVVLPVVLLAGWLALLADEYNNLGLHVAAGAGSLQNILLWTEAGYFDVTANQKPLLHLWSLGIEEQFYLVWPLFVVLVGRSPRMLSAAIIVLAIVSFAIGLRYLPVDPDSAFYLPFARFWELMIGCWLANLQRQAVGSPALPAVTSTAMSRYVPDAMAVAGTILMAVAILSFEGTDPFPGWRALLPTLGAAMLIQAGPAAKINQLLLSHRIAVFIGLISYPLYLWHWPLLSFAHIIDNGPIRLRVGISLLLIATLLAWLTYRLVERPLRSQSPRVPTVVGLVTAMASLATAGLVVHGEYIKPRSSGFGLEQIVAGIREPYYPPETLPKTLWQNVEFRTVGNGQKATLMLGDSHAEHYYSRADQLLRNGELANRRVVFGSHGWCPPIPGVLARRRPDCDRIRAAAFAYAMEPEVDTVVFAANWGAYVNSIRQPFTITHQNIEMHINVGTEGFNLALGDLENFISSLIRHGKRVYFVLQVPQSPLLDPRHAIDRNFPFFDFRISPSAVGTDALHSRVSKMVDPLGEAATRAGAIVIDPFALLCNRDTCPVLTPDGLPIFHDNSHLSAQFVRYQLTYLDAAFGMTTTEP